MVIKSLRTALADLAETTESKTAEWRAIELDRLDELHRAIWDKAVGGDLAAFDRVLKRMERRAKLLALDAPAKVAPTTPDGEEHAPACIVLPPTASSVEEWVEQYGGGTSE